MSITIPLLVAFLGASCGAYFAFVKTRKERIWADRYEALRNVVLSLETIQSHFEVEDMGQHGISVVNGKEREKFQAEWPMARHELRRSLVTLRLLFKKEHIARLVELHSEVSGAFFDYYQDPEPDGEPYLEDIAQKAGNAIEEAISVAQKHCL